MTLVDIRKIVVTVESVRHDGGPPVESPLHAGAIFAVVKNPYAGRFEPDLMPMMAELKPLGKELAKKLITALGVETSAVESLSLIHI